MGFWGRRAYITPPTPAYRSVSPRDLKNREDDHLLLLAKVPEKRRQKGLSLSLLLLQLLLVGLEVRDFCFCSPSPLPLDPNPPLKTRNQSYFFLGGYCI